MTSCCSHWMWLSGRNRPTIAISDRLRVVTASLPPEAYCPSLVLIIGCRQRPQQFPRPKRQSGRLCLDLDTKEIDQLLVGTAALHNRHGHRPMCCLPDKEHQFSSQTNSVDTDKIAYSRLLYPFVDVYCFYSYGAKDLQKIARHVGLWLQAVRPEVRASLPQMLIVLEGSHWRQEHAEAFAEEQFYKILSDITIHAVDSHFSHVEFIQVPHGDAFANIRPLLSQRAAAVREKTQEARSLFSVQHFNCLFERAFEAISCSSPEPFDFIRAAREDLPVAPDLLTHLGNFVKLVKSAADLHTFAVEVIASSILLDQYPPGMHMFKPADVFDRLYRSACLRTGQDAFQMDRPDGLLLPRAFTDLILVRLENLFEGLVQGKPAQAIHKSTLAMFSDRWPHMKSHDTCLACLTRCPQYTATCGHKFCEICVQIFGDSFEPDPYLFSIDDCILCAKDAALTVRVRPPTAGHVMLCIEGGGVCGIIPLINLMLMQDGLDLDIPVQELFTLAYGTSAGALSVLALYMEGWSPERCAIAFEELAKEAFEPPPGTPLWRWMLSLVSDAVYPPHGIEKALKRVHGHQKITDISYATTIGVKIGILATTIHNPTICLFNNYNGIGNARKGYHALKGCDTVETWEAYLPPKHIEGLGTFQDGGVLQNNPIFVAQSEFDALISADESDEPDMILNLGSGSPTPSKLENTKARPFLDFWYFRLPRGYLSLMRGERAWNDYISVKRKTEGPRNYRLDTLLDRSPSLDDATSIPLLKSLVYRDGKLLKARQEVTEHLFATLFYFELAEVPIKSGSRFNVRGRIMCVRKADDPALPRIIRRFRDSAILINGKRAPSVLEKDSHGNLRQTVSFSSGETVAIELREPGWRRSFPLSGSPYKISKLISRGGLMAYFGTNIHKRKAVDGVHGRPARRRKLAKTHLTAD